MSSHVARGGCRGASSDGHQPVERDRPGVPEVERRRGSPCPPHFTSARARATPIASGSTEPDEP